MKKLVIPAFLLGAMTATGCIFVADDDTGDDTTGGTATIDVEWLLEDGGVAAQCPAEAPTAAIHAQAASDGEVFTDLYDCVDGGGITTTLPLDTYTVWVELTDDSGANLWAQSEAVEITLDVDGEVASASFRIDINNGFFDASWEIVGSNCASVAGQGGVGLLVTNTSTTEGTDELFNCTDGEAPNVATTDFYPVGDYVITVDLVDQSTPPLSLGTGGSFNETIEYGNQFVFINGGEPVQIVLD